MPITVKTGDLLDSIDALRDLANIDVPVKLGFKVQNILKKVQTQIDSAIEEQKKCLDRHAEKDADGKQVHPKDPAGKDIPTQIKLVDPDAYTKEMEELRDIPVNFSFDCINPTELDRAPGSKSEPIQMKTATLLALRWLFVEE